MTTFDEILSSIKDRPVADLVYSSLSFYGEHRQSALPGTWFVAALSPLGVGESAIRQTLYRMEQSGALASVRQGRSKLYSPTPTTVAILEAGVERIMRAPEGRWDGQWTLIHFRFDAETRQQRDLFRDVLQAEGFAALGSGIYVHPRDRGSRISTALDRRGLKDRIVIFRGTRTDEGTDRQLVNRLWDLSTTASEYQQFLERFEPLVKQSARDRTDQQAFALRFAVVAEYLRISWNDPELPRSLAPPDFPGLRARTVTRRLYQRLTPPSLRYADSVLAAVAS